MSELLTGKNVLITGAGRNIGRSIAIEMAREGANIYFTDIDKGRCKRIEKELAAYEISTGAIVADITSENDTDRLCGWLSDKQISIDILVNNVGTSFDKTVHERSLVERVTARLQSPQKAKRHKQIWTEIYDTNVLGPAYLTDRISEMMIEGSIQGSIIFITSIHQWTVMRDASYSSSKAALGMIINELALTLAPHKIRVNGIAPGNVAEDEQGRPLRHEETPLLQSSINPTYIGRAAVYLSSEYFSKFTTGTVLKIDAGLSLCNYLVEALE